MDTNQNKWLVPEGILLLIGGAENKGENGSANKNINGQFEDLPVLKTLASLTGKESPGIEIITSATSEPEETFEEYRNAFSSLKIDKVQHIHHTTRSQVFDDKTFIERIKAADVIFLAGGNQLKYTFLYGGTPFLTTLKNRYVNDKVVIAGTSAGAMAMSTPMIYDGSKEVEQIGGMIKVTTGLEFLKDVCIDTHFVTRGRFVRMAQVILTNPTIIGLGIEEDTAVVIRNGKDVQVVGSGTVVVMDGTNITAGSIEDFTSNKTLTIRDLKIHIISDKCSYEIPKFNPPHV